jgi:hypothetical protein
LGTAAAAGLPPDAPAALLSAMAHGVQHAAGGSINAGSAYAALSCSSARSKQKPVEEEARAVCRTAS